MSILSTLGNFFGGLIFTLSLGALIFVLALAKFTEYGTLQPLIADTLAAELGKGIDPSESTAQLTALKANCTENRQNIEIDLGKLIGTIQLKCSEIMTAKGEDIPKLLANSIFDKIYYKEYSCNFLQCLRTLQGEERFSVITTSVANKFFSTVIIPLAVAVVIGLALIAVSVRTWHGIMKSVGISCIFVGIPYFLFPIVEGIIKGFVPSEQSSILQPIVATVIEPMRMNFLIVLIAGVALTVTGYAGVYLAKRSQHKPKQNQEKKR